MTKSVFFLFTCCFICLSAANGIIIQKGKIVELENEVMKHVFDLNGDRIRIHSVYDKRKGEELLSADTHKPYFEFVVNKRGVTSDDPVWNFRKITERILNNGGIEYTFHFRGKAYLNGLELEIQRQYFPNSTLIRERLVLKDISNKFGLNKKDGRLHFVFPQYSFKVTSHSYLEEIRVATFGKELLGKFDLNKTDDQRTPSFNLSQCHMFHPDFLSYDLSGEDKQVVTKGPLHIFNAGTYHIISAYEHASQDRMFDKGKKSQNIAMASVVDDAQGVKGGITNVDSDYWFIGTKHHHLGNSVVLSNNILRGGYLEDEMISSGYETVWSAFAFTDDKSQTKEIVKKYLLEQITEHPKSRIPHFYYNTWGMQRNSPVNLREILTQERILEEIGYASQLGVDIFILDDGWEQNHGEWTAHKQRLPQGLAPVVEALKARDIIPGVWFSLMGIDSTVQRFKEHPEWVIRKKDGSPLLAQWDHPVFDYVSSFAELILDDHKKLIDQGIRFFKWDAINTFNSTLPGLYHGDVVYPEKEIADRYNYLLPFYVTKTMRDLRLYNSDVVVEIDLTEPERCMVGLMPLQEGKFFWMNNGASGYGDYSTTRTKSMRTVINEYGDIFPPELFTYAVYPHNQYPYFAQRYNVNTSILAGNGFWGDLKLMSDDDRKRAGNSVRKCKKVRYKLIGKPLIYDSKVGSTPEIYAHYNTEEAFGKVVAFSGSPINYQYSLPVNPSHILCALNHAYQVRGNKIEFDFSFSMPDDTREVFIIGNQKQNMSILSSTGWIDDVLMNDHLLRIWMGSDSEMEIHIPDNLKIKKIENASYTPITGGKIHLQAKAGREVTIHFFNKN